MLQVKCYHVEQKGFNGLWATAGLTLNELHQSQAQSKVQEVKHMCYKASESRSNHNTPNNQQAYQKLCLRGPERGVNHFVLLQTCSFIMRRGWTEFESSLQPLWCQLFWSLWRSVFAELFESRCHESRVNVMLHGFLVRRLTDQDFDLQTEEWQQAG